MHNKPIYSMKYADVSKECGYCERQAKRVVGRLVLDVGKELGMI